MCRHAVFSRTRFLTVGRVAAVASVGAIAPCFDAIRRGAGVPRAELQGERYCPRRMRRQSNDLTNRGSHIATSGMNSTTISPMI